MRIVLTALIFVGGLFFFATGIGFLIDPVGSGQSFGIAARGPTGMAAIRADMTAFFVIAAVCMLVGAWRRNGDLLLVPAGLFGVALLGRIVSMAVDGTEPGFWMLPHPQT